MNKLSFALVSHFHQPVGNLEEVVERAYNRCYKPYLKILSDYPDINATFHISGSLLDYLDVMHPEIIKTIKQMVSRGQVEMIGGAYYEPILSLIPERDLNSQINLMSERIKERFESPPQGAWIPERVWRSDLSSAIKKRGLNYCILDDTLLMKAGIQKKDTYGYFLAKSLSKIAVFVSDKELRYSIPFKLPHQTFSYLKDVASKTSTDNPLLVYADDAEKFGEWAGTHEWVYKKGWLKDFFDGLMRNRDWIDCVKVSDYLESNKPLSTVRIPEGSYEEMDEWSNGIWDNFLSKYPESKEMCKKMYSVSSKVDYAKKRAKDKDNKKALEAEKELYKGQCNCSYWHGLFGGLYFYHLRSATYKHLISAERMAEDILYGENPRWSELKKVRLDSGRGCDLLMENSALSLCFDPGDGGVLKRLDYKPFSANLINTLSRKKEPYHNKEMQKYDKYPRYCLRDHFMRDDTRREDFMDSSNKELGEFCKGRYQTTKQNKNLILKRREKILNTEFNLSKKIEIIPGNNIDVTYAIEKSGIPCASSVIFAPEFNITMPFLNALRYKYVSHDKELGDLSRDGAVFDTDSFGISDLFGGLEMHLEFSKKALDIWHFPVETVSQSEGRYSHDYQASCILPRWRLDFNKSKVWDLKITWTIG